MAKYIHLIEDELLNAEHLKVSLERLDYKVTGITSELHESLACISEHDPDLLIVDIELGEAQNGVDIVKTLRAQGNKTPVIYLSGSSQAYDLKSAIQTKPRAYLSKPLIINELLANIELAITEEEESNTEQMAEQPIFIPDQHCHYRLWPSEIYYAEADGSYVKLFTLDRKYQLTSNLSNLQKQLSYQSFIRVSRKHLINKAHVDRINGNMIHMGPFSVQMSKAQRAEVLDHFKIFKTKA
jgi:DNA-binding LytR/AlgR family response regulator